MQKLIYIFNPEHDMALASNSKFYMTPAHIIKMKSDLSLLPLWYAQECENDYTVCVDLGTEEFAILSSYHNLIKDIFHQISFSMINTLCGHSYNEVIPWGWNSALLYTIEKSQTQVYSLPSYDDIEKIRELSSREQSVKLLSRYKEDVKYKFIPNSYSVLSLIEVESLIDKFGDIMLKAPWSGSGRGVRRISSALTAQDKGWISRVIRSQGSLSVEPFYDKVMDFAMEFSCFDNNVTFAGYSIFETDNNGAYKCNILDSDINLEQRLYKYVSHSDIDKVREVLIPLLKEIYGKCYKGVLGVDMMICRENEEFWIHPCVEINLRMNMGIVARRFYDNFVSNSSKGVFYVEHYLKDGEALCFDSDMKHKHPLIIENGRIVSGYISLTHICENTRYQIYAIIV